MPKAATVEELRRAVSARFAQEARHADATLADRGYGEDAWAIWFESFADITTAAMRRYDEAAVRAHLDFLSDQLPAASAQVHECIDIYYVENLMSGLDDKAKRWSWALMPEKLRQLYVAMWGEPRF